MSHNEAAAVPLAGLTAWQALLDHAEPKKGERVLIHAGAGGVGSFAIQFAKWEGPTSSPRRPRPTRSWSAA